MCYYINYITVVWYVDELLAFAKSGKNIDQLKNKLREDLTMKALEMPISFL